MSDWTGTDYLLAFGIPLGWIALWALGTWIKTRIDRRERHERYAREREERRILAAEQHREWVAEQRAKVDHYLHEGLVTEQQAAQWKAMLEVPV